MSNQHVHFGNNSATRSGTSYGVGSNSYGTTYSPNEYDRRNDYQSYPTSNDNNWQTSINTKYNQYKGKFNYGGKFKKSKRSKTNRSKSKRSRSKRNRTRRNKSTRK